MKAAVWTAYGSPAVLQVREVAKPNPKANEILIKIHAAAVTSGDARLRRADPFAVRFFFGLFRPGKPILGGVFSGEIEAVGENVRRFSVGDAVFGSSYPQFGAYAEYICVPETGKLAIKPANLRHEEAAALPFGGMTALHFLRKADIQPGQQVLIYGASGAVGTAAVQLAKYFGAEVTGVCSTANIDLVKSLGADRVIDYTQTDFAQDGARYDVIYETVNKAPVSACIAALKSRGTLILGASMVTEKLQGLRASLTGGIKAELGVAVETREAVEFLQQLALVGQQKAVIDKSYALEDIAEAHAYVDTGHKKGNVVIRV